MELVLDFLLVLGQIPFTDIQITFNEFVAICVAAYLYFVYRTYQRRIHKFFNWARYRTGVNYRHARRIVRTGIKVRRYRLGVFKRRIIRSTYTFFRRKRRAFINGYLKTRRWIRKTIRKSYMFAIDQTYGRYNRFVKTTRRAINRRQRLIANAVHRGVSAIKRVYYVKMVQIDRFNRKITRSKTVQGFIRLKNFVSQTV